MDSLIKIDVNHSKNEVILPLSYEHEKINTVQYGQRAKNILVKYHSANKIIMGKEIFKELYINKRVKYQVFVEGNTLFIGPLVGFLLGDNTHLYSTKHMEKYTDRLGVLNVTGGVVCAFSSMTIDFHNKNIYGLVYDLKHRKWKYGKLPIPSVIYRRSFRTQKVVDRLQEIGCKVFNSHKVVKSEFYSELSVNFELDQFVPKTRSVENVDNIVDYLEKFKKIILKPKALSRGRGIMVLEKKDNEYEIHDYSGKPFKNLKIVKRASLIDFLSNRRDLLDSYLVQEYINLAQIKGANFDIRIVVQKDLLDEWKCSGIECRVSNPNLLITNVSLGGKALFIEEALKSSFPHLKYKEVEKIKEEVIKLSIKTAKYLETEGKDFFEFGIDIGIDKNQKLWLIEANVFPSFKGFKTFDMKTYIKIRERPILYAIKKSGFSTFFLKG